MDNLKFGDIIRGYVIHRKLAQGNYGIIYEVVKNNIRYAMKVFTHIDENEGVSRDAIIESSILTRNEHPNVIKAKEIFLEETIPFSNVVIVMEIGRAHV